MLNINLFNIFINNNAIKFALQLKESSELKHEQVELGSILTEMDSLSARTRGEWTANFNIRDFGISVFTNGTGSGI